MKKIQRGRNIKFKTVISIVLCTTFTVTGCRGPSDSEVTETVESALTGKQIAAAAATTAAANSTAIRGLQFYPLAAPVRLLDTRPGQTACYTPGAPINTLTQTARGVCGIPADAQVIVGNATIVTPPANGFLTIYPQGAPRPTVSNLNYLAGDVRPNMFVSGLGANGQMELYSVATTHVVLDITGYYAAPGAGLYYHPLPNPVRLLDTRSTSTQACYLPGAPITGGTARVQQATGTCAGIAIPADAQVLVGNGTVVNATGNGFSTFYSTDTTRPLAANHNYVAGTVVGNNFAVRLGSTGAFNLYVETTTDFVLDATGYYSPSPSDVNGVGNLYNALGTPVRLLDTRSGQLACTTPGTPIAGTTSLTQQGRGFCGIPDRATALLGNVTAVAPASGGYLTIYPSGTPPLVSSVNFGAGTIVNSMMTATLTSSGNFNIYAATTAPTVIDISGYFAPADAPCGGPGTLASFIVSPTGNDITGNGSVAAPFATLERARDAVRGVAKTGTGQIEICLRGGTHVLTKPLSLDTRDSGSATAPVVYRSYLGERATVQGGAPLSLSFQPHSGSIVYATVPVGTNFHSLYVNGIAAVRARTPNASATTPYFTLSSADPTYPLYDGTNETTVAASCTANTIKKTQFIFAPGNLQSSWSLTGAEVVSFGRFEQPRVPILSVDFPNRRVTTAPVNECHSWDYGGTDRYFVEGFVEALDEPGEWHLDSAAGRLYYWPRAGENVNTASFIAPKLETLVAATPYGPTDAGLTAPFTRNNSFTVTLWLKIPAAGAGAATWPVVMGDPFNGKGWGLATVGDASNDAVEFDINDGAHPGTPAKVFSLVSRNQWIALAFVVDRASNQLSGYLNGTPFVSSASISSIGALADDPTVLSVGRYGNLRFAGQLDEIRIFNRILSAGEISTLVTNNAQPSGGAPVEHLTFEDGFSSSIGPNGVVYPVLPGASLVNPGRFGNGLNLSGLLNDPGALLGYVSFSGIDFKYTDWKPTPGQGYGGSQAVYKLGQRGAVQLDCENCAVSDSNFYGTGASGISSRALKSSRIERNTFTEVGASGIRIGDAIGGTPTELPALTPNVANNVVADNLVTGYGRTFSDAAGLTVFFGTANSIANNEISDGAYSGMSVGWFNKDSVVPANTSVAYNRVHDVCQKLNDGAGIYVVGRQPSTQVFNNAVSNIDLTNFHFPKAYYTSTTLLWGIYLDGSTQQVSVSKNFLREIAEGLVLNSFSPFGNRDNIVENNLFVDGKYYQSVFLDASQDTARKNIFFYGKTAATNLFQPMHSGAIGSSNNNLFWFPQSSSGLSSQLATWQGLGYDAASVNVDPLFVDYANSNFRLQSTSPALQAIGSGGIGFLPISFENIGPR